MFYIVVEPTPEGWICYNVESREEVERSLSQGGWEMPQEDVERMFGKYVNLVSPVNTRVSSDGKKVTFIPPTDEELESEAASLARQHRNMLIQSTDYLVLPDYQISEEKRQEFLVYRQALRDISKQDGWPMDIKWPAMPQI